MCNNSRTLLDVSRSSWNSHDHRRGAVQVVLQQRNSRAQTLQKWTYILWSKWRSKETSSPEVQHMFQYTHNKRICFLNWKVQRENNWSQRRLQKCWHRCQKDERYRENLQSQGINEEKEKKGPYCIRTKKRTPRYHSRTGTLVKHVLLEADDSRWIRHSRHQQASRSAESERLASRRCSSTRKQYFHTTTEFKLAVARLERSARWK